MDRIKSGFKAWWFGPREVHSLALFRILFGMTLLYEILYLIAKDFVGGFLVGPGLHFHYDLFPFLEPLPAPAMHALMWLLAAAALCIAIGYQFKLACRVFAVGFAYIFLIDKAFYNNHLYLIILMAMLFSFTDADKAFSLRSRKGGIGDSRVPGWMYLIIQLQLGIVFFYGGLAKLCPDWLVYHEPPHTILEQGPFLANLLGQSFAENLLVYGGILFDLLVPFLLLIPRLRAIGLAGLLLFNLSNAATFDDIYIFPFLMIMAGVLFMDPETIRKWLKAKPVRTRGREERTLWLPAKMQVFGWAWGLYFAFQLLFPFRSALISGDADWTMEGQRFSWRMKSQHRETSRLEFKVFDFDHRVSYPVDLTQYNLTGDQVRLLSQDPVAAADFASFLSEFYKPILKSSHIEVKAAIQVSMNGRPEAFLVDPELDLSALNPHPLRHEPWISPLPEYP